DNAWAELVREAGAEDLLRRPGWLQVFGSQAAFARTAAERDLMRHHGVRFEVLGAEEIRQLEPALAPLFGQALWFPDCGFVLDPKRLVERLVAAFVADGGTILRET